MSISHSSFMRGNARKTSSLRWRCGGGQLPAANHSRRPRKVSPPPPRVQKVQSKPRYLNQINNKPKHSSAPPKMSVQELSVGVFKDVYPSIDPAIYPPDHFKNKVVVVTGSGSGIGKETALAFSQLG